MIRRSQQDGLGSSIADDSPPGPPPGKGSGGFTISRRAAPSVIRLPVSGPLILQLATGLSRGLDGRAAALRLASCSKKVPSMFQ
ncbi:hypothetical protein ROHU_029609 [Labeo rohita]|uniref:Uncharacterized protein n=1 Tax=Labeo rohita TaxID=84645 RepID=A0A498LI27_LABRO|nr:hypothetical protein ROHU_032194 [Labeo rohita]RXN12263.1 hypothetical protein ROHU_029609 [Labeo rohita]